MSGAVSIIGENIINKSKDVFATTDVITPGKVIGLYFSSSLCQERIFTPFLAEFFIRFRSKDEKQRLEIVYVSADENEDEFYSYFSEMPWYAVPFTDFQRRSKLWKRYRVLSTPTLVLIDGATGKLITDKGRDCLSDDIEGINFPWEPRSLESVLSGKLLKGPDTIDAVSALDGKVKGFYFAAHWCPPCRSFTLQLATVYENVISAGHKFEVIFVSSDRSEASYKEFYRTMPQTWLALPYGDERVVHLTRHFTVLGIPALVLIDELGKVISYNARFLVANDLAGNEFPWRRKHVEELSEGHCATMSEDAALVYFTDGNAQHIATAKQLLNEVASDYFEQLNCSRNAADELPELRFYYEGPESDEVADTIRSFAQLEGRNPTIAILDPFEQRVYSLPESDSGEITRSDIENLIDEFKQSAMQFHLVESSANTVV